MPRESIRKALVMRNRRHSGQRHHFRDMFGYGGPNNITYNTNITNISNVFFAPPRNGVCNKTFANKRRVCKYKRKSDESKPKLWRFATSFCMLDRDIVAGMNPGELCAESMKGIRYAARGLASNACDFGSGMCKCIEGVTKGVFGVVKAFVDACD